MTKIDRVKTKLMYNEPLNALHYVKLKDDSKEQREKIKAHNGTQLFNKFLKEHPNVRLVEKPYVDCNYYTKSLDDRCGHRFMCQRIEDGGIDMIVVDDIDELGSSYADSMYVDSSLHVLDMVVYDVSTGILHDNMESQLLEHILFMFAGLDF